ncbi:MAG: MFS transporter [Proteobacteria bacterium]|nr:MFS transporter [Pseudomonadota bacterium]
MSGDTPSHRRLLAWFSLGHLANDWAPSTIWIVAPAIAAAMDLSPAEVGLLITIAHVGAALGYLPAGVLADRVANRGRLLLGTFWWVAAGYLAASFAPGFWTLALMLAIAGIGDAAWHPIATGVLAQSLPTRRAHALGIHAMTGTFAEVLAPLGIGFLLVWFDWRVAMQISTIPAILMGIAFFRIANYVPPSPHHAISLADLRALWNIWRVPRGLGVITMVSVYNMSLLAILAMTPLFLQRVHGLSLVQAGAVFSSMVLAGALVQPLVGRLSDTTGRKPVFIAGTVAAGLACLAVAWSATLGAAFLALIAAVAALYGIRSSVLASAIEFGERREATTLGLAFMLLDGVGALGAALAGAVGSLDLHYPFLLAAGMAGVAAVVAVPIMRK